jgi:hypothetical protein
MAMVGMLTRIMPSGENGKRLQVSGGDMQTRRWARGISACVLVALTLISCSKSLSPEEQAQLQSLKGDLETTRKEIAAASAQGTQYSGGLIKALIAIRLEVLKTNEALVQQRIQALESGAKITVQTSSTKPDPERAKTLEAELAKQEAKVIEAEAKASVSGGLIGAMAAMGAATERNSRALIRQQYLIAKHGLAPFPQGAVVPVATGSATNAPAPETRPTNDGEERLRDQILEVKLLRKRYSEQDYQNYIFFDIAIEAKGLDKPARAVKGSLRLTDLFGEQKFGMRWTIDKPVAPGASFTEKGSGFKYNQFTDSHQWVRNTELENMKVVFRVDSILYQDGTTKTFD